MNVPELRVRADAEIVELGREPADPRECATWMEGRRGVVMLLASLADHDAQRLRAAARSHQVATAARDLLLEAALECRLRRGP